MKARFFSERTLCLSYLSAMLMVGLEVSWIVALFASGVVFWRWCAEKWNGPVLNKKVTGFLSVLVLAQVLIEFKTLIGQEPAYTFLLGLSALRVMEYDGSRDRKFLILLGFILLAVKALFTIDIYWIIPTALIFVGLWSSLLSDEVKNKRRYLLVLFLKSLPIAAVLFVVFPRVVIPWALSRGSPQGEIGFSEDLNPGGIANLASSDKVAFRVRFLKENPTVSGLYWRGAILNKSSGLSWRPFQQAFLPQQFLAERSAADYEVALEPTSKSFLFSLDPTEEIRLQDFRVLSGEGQQFRTHRPIQKAIVYQGVLGKSSQGLPAPEQDLQLPKLSGQVLNWVEQQREKKQTSEEALKTLENFFSDPKFAYTLSPGTYGDDELNEFLFKRRRGFCEHFAGSYATLARALGIPARVVLGYHGGVYNEWGNFWKVSQKDAHAWVEVFVQNKWQQVDPTSWVAPLRLRIGAENFFGLSEADQKAFARSLDWKPSQIEDAWGFSQFSFWLESLNYRWIYLLIEFDLEAQGELLASIKEIRWILLLVLFICAAGYLLLRKRSQNPSHQTTSEKLLYEVELWGQKKSHPRQVSETPLNYFKRLEDIFKNPVFKELAESYERSAYTTRFRLDAKDAHEFLKKIRQIKAEPNF